MSGSGRDSGLEERVRNEVDTYSTFRPSDPRDMGKNTPPTTHASSPPEER